MNIKEEHVLFLINSLIKEVNNIYPDIESKNLTSVKLSERIMDYFDNHNLKGLSKTSFRNEILEIRKKGGDCNGINIIAINNKFINLILNRITLVFFNKNFYDWFKENDVSKDKTKKIFSEIYFRRLYKTFTDTNGSEKKILDIIKNKNKLNDNDIEWFLGVIPEIFLNDSIRRKDEDEEYFGLYDSKSQYVSNPIHFNGDNTKYLTEEYDKLIYSKEILSTPLKKRIEGTYLIHALSPIDDSVFLLCELGRFARISDALRHQKKEFSIKIDCVDEEWSKSNKTVIEFSNGIDIDFKHNIKIRKLLYSRILSNLKQKENFGHTSYRDAAHLDIDSVHHITINEEIQQYFRFSKDTDLLEKVDNYYKLIIKGLASTSNFIKNIKENFLQENEHLEEDMIKYILFQRYLQLKYPNYLKIGIKREFNFDDTFNQLNSGDITQSKNYNFYGIYFKDYVVKIKKGRKIIDKNIHPYFFPSGNYYKYFKQEILGKEYDFKRIYKANGNPNKIAKEKLENLIKKLKANVILLSDFNDLDKIKEIINRYNTKELSTIISDFLSFIFYFFDKDEGIEIIEYAKMGQEFEEIWNKSFINKQRKNIYNEHFENFLAFSYNTTRPPFYFYPYIFALEDLKNYRQSFKDSYVILIHETLKKLNTIIKYN